MADDDWRAANRALWDERVPAHAASAVYDIDGVVAGRDDLRPWEPADVGDVSGRDLIHLMWVALGDDGKSLREHAIGASYERWDAADGSYASPDTRFENTSSWERLYNLGDVLTAVLGAGLTIELFTEHDVTNAPTPWLEQRDDRLWHFPDGAYRFPVTYSLRARRPREAAGP